jgi:phage shock protein A
MSETLVSRVKRLISGSVHGMLESLDATAAETVMCEAIGEVDRTIDDVRGELGTVIASRHRANRIMALNRGKIDDLAGRIKLAVDQNRDDLAEAAIARQIDLEAQLPVLQDTLVEAANRQRELEGFVAALSGRKREMEQDLKAFVAARTGAATSGGGSAAPMVDPAGRRAEKARGAFDRAFGSGVPGIPPVDRSASVRLDELEVLLRSTEVANRLAAVKTMKRAS